MADLEPETDRYGFIRGAQQYSGESADDLPPEMLRERETKWLEMLNSWDKWMAKRHKKVKVHCRKGIPPSLRGRAWLYLSGAKVKREQNKGRFQELASQPGDPMWVDVIERDLHRQFPFHQMFTAKGGHGQQDLSRVLRAYTVLRPQEGYCQAQAPLAALLLMHMPAEDAFWGLVQICEKYLPGYYSPGLEAVQVDGEVLFSLLRRACPPAHLLLTRHGLPPPLYMTEWFMCVFSRSLPWGAVLRVWDMFLCEGVKVLFRVGLVLLRGALGRGGEGRDQYETMETLKNLDPRLTQESVLIPQVIELSLPEREVEREHLAALRRWKELGGGTHSMAAGPPRRQDPRQNPAVAVAPPLATGGGGGEDEYQRRRGGGGGGGEEEKQLTSPGGS